MGIFMYKYNNHLLPMSLDKFFVRSFDIHSHNARSSGDFRSDSARTTLKLFSMKCFGLRLNPNIPMNVKSSTSLQGRIKGGRRKDLGPGTPTERRPPSNIGFRKNDKKYVVIIRNWLCFSTNECVYCFTCRLICV